MINPEEIKNQAWKWWKPFLQSHIDGKTFFPRIIDRIRKVKPGDVTERFEALQQEIELLYRYSKNQTGAGYLVQTSDRNFRRTGSHELPDKIVFETSEDYISFLGRKKEWKTFLLHYEQVVSEIPSLKEWAWLNCLWLTEDAVDWTDILKVCRYFIQTPRPNLYLRQLPVEMHTKFIEDNVVLIQSLLDFLLPGHIRNTEQKRFAEHFYLKYDEPLVRLRILDKTQVYAGNFSDISIPLSDFEQTDLPARNIFIAENKMNFLTIPDLADTIAVWSGGGFNISYLKNVKWLKDRNVFYWGDIDVHGFQILHQLRTYYPHVQSVMMDRQTFDHFDKFTVNGAESKAQQLELLTTAEMELYLYLKTKSKKNRLEQEKINQAYVYSYMRSLFDM